MSKYRICSARGYSNKLFYYIEQRCWPVWLCVGKTSTSIKEAEAEIKRLHEQGTVVKYVKVS